MEYKLRNNIFLKDKLAWSKYQQIKLKLRFTLSYLMKVLNQKVYWESLDLILILLKTWKTLKLTDRLN